MAEQDECKLFALFIWIDDNPVKGNVFKLSNITKPFYYHNEHQKRDFGLYKTGQEVEARFDRNQKARAIIGGIEDETKKGCLEDILRTPLFNKLVNKYCMGKDHDSEIENQTPRKDTEKPTKTLESQKRQKGNSTPRKSEKTVVNTPPKKSKTPSKKADSDKTKRKRDGSVSTDKSPKRKKGDPSQKELERIGEDLNLLNLVSGVTSVKPKPVVSTPTKNGAKPKPVVSTFSPTKNGARLKPVKSTPTPTKNGARPKPVVSTTPSKNGARPKPVVSTPTPTKNAARPKPVVPTPSPTKNGVRPKSVITPNLVRESLDLVDQGGVVDPMMRFTDLLQDPPFVQEHCCKEVLARLSLFEGHIQWLTSNIQQLYQIITNDVVRLISEVNHDRQSSSIDNSVCKPEPPTSATYSPRPASTSELNSPKVLPPLHEAATCSETMPSPKPIDTTTDSSPGTPASASSASLLLYNGYTMDMLRNKIRLCPDYKKGTTVLFRLLYSEKESKGRSLKGKKSTKSGPVRPGLEDLSKLSVIYDLVKAKWPGTEEEQINSKIGHLLKPSYHTSLESLE